MTKRDISQARLKQVLSYDKDTGVFRWRERLSDKVRVGDIAGHRATRYVFIRIDGEFYRAHRLAWRYMTGEWPRNEIDHIDGNGSNNAFSNLRDVDHSTNNQNRRAPQRNNKSSRLLGVTRDKKKWHMQIQLRDGTKIRKNFETPEEAHAAYLSAKRLHHEGNTL